MKARVGDQVCSLNGKATDGGYKGFSLATNENWYVFTVIQRNISPPRPYVYSKRGIISVSCYVYS